MPDSFVSKTELLNRLIAAKAQLDAVLSRIPESRREEPGLIEGWSVKDLLAHFIAHEQRALEEIRRASRGERPDLPMSDNDAFNLGAVFAARPQPYEPVKLALDRSFAEIIEAVQRLSESDFEPDSQVVALLDDTIDGALANNTYEHYADHLPALEALTRNS